METSVKITLIIVLGAIILGALIFSFVGNVMPSQTITANGNSQIKAVPDLVSVYFSVQTKAETAEQAKNENAKIVDDVLTALIKQGFERKEITTQNYNIYPEYIWKNNQQQITGYMASHEIKIEFSALSTDKIGKAIDAGVDAGALISYINFELSAQKQNEYKVQALKQASEDARIKAESIASGLGKKLGRVYSVSSSNFDYYPWQIYRNMDMMAGGLEAKQATTSIQPGEKDINAQVSVVYKIR